MPDDPRSRYLAELDAVLPMPIERRAEIVEEIATHLDDAVAERVERGVDPDRAEADAQARFGSPVDLARSLARPEQTPWRVLAGVGAAVRSGIGYWIYGYLFGSLVIFLGALALAMLVQTAGSVFGTGWNLMTSDQGWNTMLTAFAIGFGCYFAGRVLPDRLATRSRRLAVDVRPWILVAAVPLVAAMTVFVLESPQNPASVVALTLAPLALVLGAYRPDLLPGRIRLGLVVILTGFAFVAILSIGMAARSVSGGEGPAQVDEPVDRGLGMVGPEWSSPATFDGSSWELVEGTMRWHGELADGVSLAGFHDLRLEAWRSVDHGYVLDPAYDRPFATATVTGDGRSYTADIVTTDEPGVTAWTLVLTGVDRNGTRYVIDASGGGSSTFTGSAWDWIVAVATGD
jgi:hypothetical protein